MQQYHELLKEVVGKGDVQFEPRTQEYILGITGAMSKYDLREGFPLVTTKDVPPRLPSEELLWKLRGERNVRSLVNRNVHIWTANAFDRYLRVTGRKDEILKHTPQWDEALKEYTKRLKNDSEFAETAGDLGPVYGYQWRHGFTRNGVEIDQLRNVVEGIKSKSGSRYHVLNAWNPSSLADMALGPCPFWHQFTAPKKDLDLMMVQRSCDVYLGVPFNVAQDSLLTHLVAQETDRKARIFTHSLANVHAYLGVPPRANFWTDPENVADFQRKFNGISRREDYLDLRDTYLAKAGPESKGNERKDHIPFILEQLSKEPRELPLIEIAKGDLFDLIDRPFKDVATVTGYNPHKWDSKAVMAT